MADSLAPCSLDDQSVLSVCKSQACTFLFVDMSGMDHAPMHLLISMLNSVSMRPSLTSAYAQDTTTRIWDIRQPGKSLAVLSGRMGAVRSLRFSSDGRFLAMAEPADFVHVFDVKAGFHRSDWRCLPNCSCHSNVCAVPVSLSMRCRHRIVDG